MLFLGWARKPLRFHQVDPGRWQRVERRGRVGDHCGPGEGWMRLCEQVHTGKLDLGKATDAWSDYAPTVLSVLAKMALPRATRP